MKKSTIKALTKEFDSLSNESLILNYLNLIDFSLNFDQDLPLPEPILLAMDMTLYELFMRIDA